MNNDLNTISHILKLEGFRSKLKSSLLQVLSISVVSTLVLSIFILILNSIKITDQAYILLVLIALLAMIGIVIAYIAVNFIYFRRLVTDSTKDNSIQMLLGVGINRNKLFVTRYLMLVIMVLASCLGMGLTYLVTQMLVGFFNPINYAVQSFYDIYSGEELASIPLGYPVAGLFKLFVNACPPLVFGLEKILINIFYYLIAIFGVPALCLISSYSEKRRKMIKFEALVFALSFSPLAVSAFAIIICLLPMFISIFVSYVIIILIPSEIIIVLLFAFIYAYIYKKFAPGLLIPSIISSIFFINKFSFIDSMLGSNTTATFVVMIIAQVTVLIWLLIQAFLSYRKNIDEVDY